MRRRYHTTTSTEAPIVMHGGELGEKLVAAAVGGAAIVVLLLLALVLLLWYFASLDKGRIWGAAALSLTAGVAYTAYHALKWSRAVATRDWSVDDDERERARSLIDVDRERLHRMEDEDRLMAQAALSIAQQPAEPLPDAAAARRRTLDRLPYVALSLLMRHYSHQRTTRAACTKEGLCTQPEWNLANATFHAIGFKQGYTMTIPHDNLAVAWADWQKRIEIHDDDVWAIHEGSRRLLKEGE